VARSLAGQVDPLRGWISKVFLGLFTMSFLGSCTWGCMPAQQPYLNITRIFAVPYFAFFWLMPFYSRMGGSKPVPERVNYHG
jgi:ubiquinol-cytochrome c reductase cytochrome b subunit